MTDLSNLIRECRAGVVANPYQGKDKKVVFVCSMGILRSATGARMYGHKHNTRSAGTWDDALIPLTPVLIDWADELVFVNAANYNQVLTKWFDEDHVFKNIVAKAKVLNIPDTYEHMHPKLQQSFKEQYEPV